MDREKIIEKIKSNKYYIFIWIGFIVLLGLFISLFEYGYLALGSYFVGLMLIYVSLTTKYEHRTINHGKMLVTDTRTDAQPRTNFFGDKYYTQRSVTREKDDIVHQTNLGLILVLLTIGIVFVFGSLFYFTNFFTNMFPLIGIAIVTIFMVCILIMTKKKLRIAGWNLNLLKRKKR